MVAKRVNGYCLPKPLEIGDNVVVMFPSDRTTWHKGIVTRVYTNVVEVRLPSAGDLDHNCLFVVGFNQFATGAIVVRCVPDIQKACRLAANKKAREAYKVKTERVAMIKAAAKKLASN